MAVKNLLIRTILISATFTLVLSPVLSANTKSHELDNTFMVIVPFQKWIQYTQENLSEKNLSMNEEVGGFSKSNDDGTIHVASDRVSISSSFKTKLINTFDSKTIEVNLEFLGAQILMQNLNLNIELQKDFGFGSATLRLNYLCQGANISIINQSPLKVQTSLNLGVVTAEGVNWDLNQATAKVDLIDCKGTSGLDQQIQKQVEILLKNRIILDLLQNSINQNVNKYLQEKIVETINNYQEQFKIGENLKHFFDIENNFYLESGVNAKSQFTDDEVNLAKQQAGVSLLIKKENLENLVKEKLNEILKTKDIASSLTPELTKLTCSRWAQTFAWPALKSLNKCFELTIRNRIQKLNLNDVANKQFEIEMGSWALAEQQTLAYFSSKLKISSTNLQVNIESLIAKPDENFVKSSGRSARISTKLIQSALESWLTQNISRLSESHILKIFNQDTKIISTQFNSFLIQLN